MANYILIIPSVYPKQYIGFYYLDGKLINQNLTEEEFLKINLVVSN